MLLFQWYASKRGLDYDPDDHVLTPEAAAFIIGSVMMYLKENTSATLVGKRRNIMATLCPHYAAHYVHIVRNVEEQQTTHALQSDSRARAFYCALEWRYGQQTVLLKRTDTVGLRTYTVVLRACKSLTKACQRAASR